MTATELACALGERSDAGDCADIRLGGAIPGSGENGGSWTTMEPERTVFWPRFPPLAGPGPI